MPAMELKPTPIILFFFLILLVVPPGLSSRGRLNVKTSKSMGSEVYEIDYRGPETHTYIPPPNRAGDGPRIHHQASMARRKSKLHKARRHGN